MGLRAIRDGFKEGCKKVIGLNDCLLKSPYPGVLLTTVGIDPDNSFYPPVIGVVELENKATWKWFLHLLIEDFKIYDEQKWTLISDEQKANSI